MLGLCSLEEMRLRSDLHLTYRIIHKLIDLEFTDFFEYAYDNRTRNNGYKLQRKFCSTDPAKNFFSNRVVDPWNSLLDTVVNAPSVDTFKSRLENINLTRFLKGGL